MAIDRTSEFHAAVSAISTRTSKSPAESRRLLSSSYTNGSNRQANKHTPKSEFSRMAAKIGHDINSTGAKLQRLAQLAKRKTLFDDKSTEISELIYVIKHDIAELNNDIGNLQTFVKQRRNNAARITKGKKGSELNEHNDNVVVLLQSKLANTSMGFKEVLEIRTQNMKASKDRSEQFISGAVHSATPPPVLSSSSPLYNPIERPHSAQPYTKKPYKSDLLSLNMDEEESSIGMPSQQQSMQLVQRQDQYLSQRGQAIESIESTIHELGSIFQQLAQMVSEQAETVQRIDANTDDIVTNVGGAQRELLKYYARVTSNRWLMIKIFGVLIIFFLLWVLVS